MKKVMSNEALERISKKIRDNVKTHLENVLIEPEFDLELSEIGEEFKVNYTALTLFHSGLKLYCRIVIRADGRMGYKNGTKYEFQNIDLTYPPQHFENWLLNHTPLEKIGNTNYLTLFS